MLRRSTLVIVLVFIVLVGAAILLQRTDFGKEAEPTPTEQIRLFTMNSEELIKISIEDQAGNQVVYVKDAENVWHPEGEGLVIGNMTAFNNALTQIGTLRALSVIADPPGVKEIGLEPPSYKVVVSGSDGSTQEIEVGAQTPTGSGYYIRTVNSDIAVVSLFNVDSVLELITSPDMVGTPTPEVTPTVGEASTQE